MKTNLQICLSLLRAQISDICRCATAAGGGLAFLGFHLSMNVWIPGESEPEPDAMVEDWVPNTYCLIVIPSPLVSAVKGSARVLPPDTGPGMFPKEMVEPARFYLCSGAMERAEDVVNWLVHQCKVHKIDLSRVPDTHKEVVRDCELQALLPGVAGGE